MKLEKNDKLDISEILNDLEHYRPRRRGWHWRERVDNQKLGQFEYHETSKCLETAYRSLRRSILRTSTLSPTVS